MAIGIDDLGYDEEEQLLSEQNVEENTGDITEESSYNIPSVSSQSEDDAITAFLKTKGIEDPNKIKFENEVGDVEEVAWGDLSNEEQFNILNTSNVDPDRALDDSEISFINEIRLGGMTIDEYKAMLYNQGAQAALNQNITPQYEIDSIPDDELYLADLQQKLGEDITPEQLTAALEAEKQNPELYSKKVKGIRNEYKNLEDQARNNQAAAIQREQMVQVEQFQNDILREIQGLNKIGNFDVELSVDDMNDVANFILSFDPANINYFGKALNDPRNVVKAAWFLTKGEQAFNDISDYFTQQIKEVAKAQYKKGLEDGKSGKSSISTAPRVVKKTQVNNNQRVIKTIDDLD